MSQGSAIEMPAVDLAYLAGIVDADGFISIQRARKPQRTYYNARIGITGIRREPHDLAASLFGGNVTQQRSRDCLSWVWLRSGWQAVPAITALMPFLRVKRAQAALALDLQETLALATQMWPASLQTQTADLFGAMRELNVRRGRTPKAGGRDLDGRTWDQMPQPHTNQQLTGGRTA